MAFEIPADYRPALRLWGGGVDMSRPDTPLNRALVLWEAARDFTRRFWP